MKKLTTLLLLLTGLSCYAQKLTLALNLKPDSTYILTSNVHMSVDMDIPDRHMVINTVISTTVAHKVISVTDSVYEIEAQYKAINYHYDLGEQANNYGTGPEGRNTMFSTVARGMLNKPFYMTISKWGRVLAVKGLDSVYNNMFGGLPDISEAQKTIFKNLMAQQYGEKVIRTNFQNALEVFPVAAVGVGDKWEAGGSAESMLSVKFGSIYRLMGTMGDNYPIHCEAIIKPTDDTAYKASMGWMMRLVKVTGISSASIKLDKKTCWVTESKISNSIKCTGEVQESRMNPGGLSFPMTVVMEVTVSGK